MVEKELDSLEIRIRNLYENVASRRKTAGYLTELGYEGCDDGGNIDADRVKNVLHQEVINRCFAKRVDLTTKPSDRQGLKKLLCDSLPKNIKTRQIDLYFNLDVLVQHRRKLKSPLDFIEKNILYSSTIQTFLKKFIECQFQLKWATDNGWPREFSYYAFCEVVCQHWTQTEMRTKVLKNTVRNAQVKVQLYRYYKTHTQNEFHVKDLCPTVYVRTGKKQWRSLNGELEAFAKNGVNNFDWISEPIRRYILSKAETIPKLPHAKLTKPTLYWAVVEDSNFQAGENLKLNQIGKTQVYVGKANKGIKDRWLTSPSSHCHKMKRCLSVFRDNKTYNAKLISRCRAAARKVETAEIHEVCVISHANV